MPCPTSFASYQIRPISEGTTANPGLKLSEGWRNVVPLNIEHFHPRSSAHRPQTQVRLAYSGSALYVRFDVQDRYVRSVHRGFNGAVCKDSCVEFFTQPAGARGYFNFETNAGGSLHCSYITDPTIGLKGFAGSTMLDAKDLAGIVTYHSLPDTVDPEITEPIHWTVSLSIPMALLEKYAGPLPGMQDQTWRANFYKCGDATSQPHWASWNPIGEQLSFHKPEYFGEIVFASGSITSR